MGHTFDREYWDEHWGGHNDDEHRPPTPVSPYLARETTRLTPGTALEAGCGAGTEALWLARHGWDVTGADLSSAALARAARAAEAEGLAGSVEWIEADLMTWEPARSWDLVTTHYAHPDAGQLAFYERLARWVAPGGTLLIVGHLHDARPAANEHPEEATATIEGVRSRFPAPGWEAQAAYEHERRLTLAGRELTLHDVVVRLRRAGRS